MNADVPHIVLAGGGTGGHLFPGLAVAGQLCRRLPLTRITFAGAGKPFERRHVEAAGYAYQSVACRPAPSRPWHVPGFLARHVAGYYSARRLLRRQRVDLVIGLGGYASVPLARAAHARGVPLVLLEQNVEPGRATRWLAPWADALCVAFEETVSQFPRKTRAYVTGTPLRPDFQRVAHDGPPRLLVLGGSHGAASLNESVPRAIYQARRHFEGWEIVHQAGEGAVESTRTLYGKFGLSAMVVPFLRNMPRVLSRAELVVSRAGGSTLAELSAVGTAAVLVPYPHATADHQRKNADLFRRRGGCPVVDERDAGGRLAEAMAEAMTDLLAEPGRRQRIAYTMSQLGRPDATDDVVKLICRMLAASGRAVPAGSIDVDPLLSYHAPPWEMDVHWGSASPWHSAGKRRLNRSRVFGPI